MMHSEGQSGVDREARGGVSALLDENTKALRLGTLHLLAVLAALRRRLLRGSAHVWNAGHQVASWATQSFSSSSIVATANSATKIAKFCNILRLLFIPIPLPSVIMY
ncbi:hypothetical protein Acr_12g0008630 [Actinidia rufa]|uniref:Uncharacterized protein n=1 Tax=Actinidia rufa TaxID=165716 RepID=A0A7J0FI03_9ERIC|nr:hypothetical protein Acr_12g0008630 [Actinidia rufa]